MKRALLMTVGTGVGRSPKQVESLANGLVKALIHYKADSNIFFGSQLSKNTIKVVEEIYQKRAKSKLNYEIITLEDVDRFEECFQKIRQVIKEYPDYEVIIDYTSGTKTMTMSAAIASVLYHKELTLVTGERGDNGLVLMHTEEIKTQSLYSAYDELLMEKMREAFNNYRYDTALGFLGDIIKVDDRKSYQNLIQAYNYWDKFNHQAAFDLIKKVDIAIDPSNKEFLGTLINSRDKKEYYLLADLLNNSHRRFVEGKYDDALARLYRAVEFISQTRLKLEYGIDSSDLDLELLPDFARKQYAKKINGKISIGLREGYKLLRQLDDPIGSSYFQDKRLIHLLNKRNQSILAHGFEPITLENSSEVEELKDKVIFFASLLYPEIEDLMKKAEYMKI
ncbi:TIGR02710 family CRISPR-associated CARF protein [Methanobacterium sp. MZD130B]|uniref:TIGR02710 family CRISPR-associated CARF protein n=1 Tax=Methanobacterium sp. MZD130B TaxID=3394378 RepID=UPI0039FD6F83